MKDFNVASVLVLAVVLISSGQTKAPLKDAANQSNGRLWKALDENGKNAYVIGYADAVGKVALMATMGSQSSKLSSLYWPASLTGTEVHAALDKYYESPENAAQSISGAISDIAIRSEKLTRATITKLLDDPCGNSPK